MRKVILWSGGIDSTVCLELAIAAGDDVVALAADWGQRMPAILSRALDAEWRGDAEGVTVHCRSLPAVPIRDDGYMPGRNAILLSMALSLAEDIEAEAVVFGVNRDDGVDYPDCRPEFVEAFRAVARCCGIALEAPLLHRSKRAVVALARELGVDIEATRSCYRDDDEPCGECRACVLRARST